MAAGGRRTAIDPAPTLVRCWWCLDRGRERDPCEPRPQPDVEPGSDVGVSWLKTLTHRSSRRHHNELTYIACASLGSAAPGRRKSARYASSTTESDSSQQPLLTDLERGDRRTVIQLAHMRRPIGESRWGTRRRSRQTAIERRPARHRRRGRATPPSSSRMKSSMSCDHSPSHSVRNAPPSPGTEGCTGSGPWWLGEME